MPIRISLQDQNVVIEPQEKLGPLWGAFCMAVIKSGGAIRDGRGVAIQGRCGKICSALSKLGFPLAGSKEAVALATAQGYRRAHGTAQTEAFGATTERRPAQIPLELWAHAGLNLLMSRSVKGPSKFDRVALTKFYVLLCNTGGLSDPEWAMLATKLRKYHRQIGESP